MKYLSTRGGIEPCEFLDAVMMGLADDGGLVIPDAIPDVRSRLAAWSTLSYTELALEIISLFATDVPREDLRALIERAYTAENWPGGVAPTVAVGDLHVLELWHGPTLAFKDVALQLLGNLFEYVLARRGGRLNILGATSGDTGSAAISGVRGRAGIDIFMMHPRGRTSPIQARQMTTVLDDNVHNIAVEGDFDDCQRIMKELAGDLAFKRRHSLGAVNSVNWARVLAQIVYYFKSAFDVLARGAGVSPARDEGVSPSLCVPLGLAQEDVKPASPPRAGETPSSRAGETPASRVTFAVPTGNFGDVLAGWYAMKMGCPIGRLILATNVNDILARFFASGIYSAGTVTPTSSPSMDIQVSSNFERYLYYRVGEDPVKLTKRMNDFARGGSLGVALDASGVVDPQFVAGAAGESDVLATIADTWRRHGYLLDPHTAVGVHVAKRLRRDGETVICLATAHPAKFPAAIEQAVGEKIAHHDRLDALAHLPTRCADLPNDKQAVRTFIETTLERRTS